MKKNNLNVKIRVCDTKKSIFPFPGLIAPPMALTARARVLSYLEARWKTAHPVKHLGVVRSTITWLVRKVEKVGCEATLKQLPGGGQKRLHQVLVPVTCYLHT